MTHLSVEADPSMAQYVELMNAGEDIVITEKGQAVARIVPVPRTRRDDDSKQAAMDLMSFVRNGLDLGGLRIDRNELYDRRA